MDPRCGSVDANRVAALRVRDADAGTQSIGEVPVTVVLRASDLVGTVGHQGEVVREREPRPGLQFTDDPHLGDVAERLILETNGESRLDVARYELDAEKLRQAEGVGTHGTRQAEPEGRDDNESARRLVPHPYRRKPLPCGEELAALGCR